MSVGLLAGAMPRGSVEPRLWTPPLRDLDEPGATAGPLQTDFARDILRAPFDPWQEWLAKHAGELDEDGRPRFWLILVLVARQNGKTHVPVVLSPYWSLIDEVPMILGTSTKLDYARESWWKAIKLMETASKLPGDPLYGVIPSARRHWLRQANGEQEWTLGDDCRYKIAPARDDGGRSLTINRLVLDELRQHSNRSAWDASVPATEAVWDSQVWALSNAGDDTSVVLNAERASALAFIDTGVGDPRVGIFEWSAPDGADPTDPCALAMANPQFGCRIDPQRLINKGRTALREGGEVLTGFRTESMCQAERLLKAAIEPGSWSKCLDPGSLAGLRGRLAAVVDVSPDGGSVALYTAACLADDRVRVDPAKAWSGPGCVDAAERELPGELARVRPQVLGWFPNGPAAAMATRLRRRKGVRSKIPPHIRIEEIKAETAAVCMGFEQAVIATKIAHSGDPLLDAHIESAEKESRAGGTWVFNTRPGRRVNAVYAAAGAVHLARTMPAPVEEARVITVPRRV